MSLNITRIRLQCTEGSSNKFYKMAHVSSDNGVGSFLIKNWGKNSTKGVFSCVYKDSSTNRYDYGQTILNKKRKNYHEIDRGRFEEQTLEKAVHALSMFGFADCMKGKAFSLEYMLAKVNSEKSEKLIGLGFDNVFIDESQDLKTAPTMPDKPEKVRPVYYGSFA